ncbi:ribonuclease P protein component [Catenulispora yoronensis]|uniref:Ribonuclease P protein component n=1 Tax=Catenulispora yoronensis TaxID=450799 RepID=A0ABP5FL57_9ACTN
MLSSAHRMRRSTDFGAAVRGGRRAGRSTLVAHLAVPSDPSTAADAPALAGFVVSKAVGPAVVRTAVKRRLRHLVRARLALLPPGSRLVVRALPPAATADSRALGADLDSALRKLLR